MASSNATSLIQQVNQYIRGYVPDYADDLNLNRILLQMVALADAGGGNTISATKKRVTSSDFSTNTECPISAFKGFTLAVWWVQGQKYLESSAGEFGYLAGGGFQVLLPGFNKNDDNYIFYVDILI